MSESLSVPNMALDELHALQTAVVELSSKVEGLSRKVERTDDLVNQMDRGVTQTGGAVEFLRSSIVEGLSALDANVAITNDRIGDLERLHARLADQLADLTKL